MHFAFRLRSHVLAVELPDNPEWQLAISTLSDILKVDEQDLRILPDGQEPTGDLSEVHADTDLLIHVDGWAFQSPMYHKVMRAARNYCKQHPLPAELRKAKKGKYKIKQLATDLTLEVQKSACGMHEHMEDVSHGLHAHQADTQADIADVKQDVNMRCDALSAGLREVKQLLLDGPGQKKLQNAEEQLTLQDGDSAGAVEMQGDPAGAVEMPVASKIATPAGEVEMKVPAIVTAAPAVEMPVKASEIATPGSSSKAPPMQAPQLWGIDLKTFGRGSTIYIPPEHISGSENQGSEGSEGSEGSVSGSKKGSDSSSSVTDASEIWRDAPVRDDDIQDATDVAAQSDVAAQPMDATDDQDVVQPVQKAARTEVPATEHVFSKLAEKVQVEWPPSMAQYHAASESEKAAMFQKLSSAFEAIAKTSFELMAERDIALAHLEAFNKVKENMENPQ